MLKSKKSVSVYECSALGGQERVSDPLELTNGCVLPWGCRDPNWVFCESSAVVNWEASLHPFLNLPLALKMLRSCSPPTFSYPFPFRFPFPVVPLLVLSFCAGLVRVYSKVL